MIMGYEFHGKYMNSLLPITLTEWWRLASEYVAYAGTR